MNRAILQHPWFDPLDRQIARWLARWGEGLVPVAAALASRNIRLGHVCLELAAPPWDTNSDALFTWPGPEEWDAACAGSAAVGAPGSGRPLILDRGRLYLGRYHAYETQCARQLLARSKSLRQADPRSVSLLAELFDGADPRVTDQLRAAQYALSRQLCIISGGPGTGKTATAVRILAALASSGLRIGVAAPTGKAADRLQVAIRQFAGAIPEIHQIVPQTLHRLLRLRTGNPPKYGPENPLPYDVVLVDECSMVDLATATKLLVALSPEARLVLLGDHNQLASVEAGAILGDVAAAAEGVGPLSGSFVRLTHNFRFQTGGSIAALCVAILSGDADEAMRLLRPGTHDELTWIDPRGAAADVLDARLHAGFERFANATEPAEALGLLATFRVLCAVRQGRSGTEAINALAARLRPMTNTPLLVTSNDYGLGLFNGDAGVVMRSGPGGESPSAWFASEAAPRQLPIAALPPYEPAFAITIHKSQGSEFDEVLCVLPDADSPILTRELLYTAVSRARRSLVLLASETAIRAAIHRATRRQSGLRERLGEG